jgi:hypothetical protein
MGFDPYRIVMKRHATNRSNRVRTGKAVHANTADIAFVRPQTLDHKNTPFYTLKILGVDKNLPAIIANPTNATIRDITLIRIKGMDHHAGTPLKSARCFGFGETRVQKMSGWRGH